MIVSNIGIPYDLALKKMGVHMIIIITIKHGDLIGLKWGCVVNELQ